MPGPRNRPRKPKKKSKPILVPITSPKPTEFAAEITEPVPTVVIEVAPISQVESQPNRYASLPGNASYLDPSGTGEKLSGVWDFLETSYAEPPALSDVRYAPYARHDVLDVLRNYLPEELALTVWYNKSRKEGRICAVCRRFYKLGDKLPSLGPGDQVDHEADPRCLQERRISGLCTFMCFGAAAYNTPGAGGAWGKMESQIDPETAWAINHAPPPIVDDEGLGSLFKLTRRADVGLGHYIDLLERGSETTQVFA